MANGHSLKDLRRPQGLELTGDRVVAATRNGVYRRDWLDNIGQLLFISWLLRRAACDCNAAGIKLRRWVKSHPWIPLVPQRLRRVHDHLAGRG